MSKQPPSTLKELVLSDLARAQRLVKKINDPGGIDPQFRIATPEGDYHIAMQLSENPDERLRQMRLVSLFMAWKLSPGFTLASELHEPDSVYCVGVTHAKTMAAISLIERNPLRFSPVQWMTPEMIGDDAISLLPRGVANLDAGVIAELCETFGSNGPFPAVHIESGRIGG
jgi:hypothetical protein